MRTIVNLPQAFIDALAEICQEEKISRAEAIRRAIRIYVRQKTTTVDDYIAFGIWKSKRIDSLTYVDRIRSEWQSGENSK